MRHLLIPPGPILEKLPSSVHIPAQITEFNLGESRIPIPLDFGTNLCNVRSHLESIVRKVREVLPQGWREDVLTEKLQQHISSLPFHHFLCRETAQMNTALSKIHSSLLSLLTALDPRSHGDPHTLTHDSPALPFNPLTPLTLGSLGVGGVGGAHCSSAPLAPGGVGTGPGDEVGVHGPGPLSGAQGTCLLAGCLLQPSRLPQCCHSGTYNSRERERRESESE